MEFEDVHRPPPNVDSRSIIDTICYRLVNDTRYILNEEATKTHLILPFIQSVLGYSNPENLRPEDVADIGTRNQKKVDYSLYGPNNNLRIVVECKALNVVLDEQHAIQLQEYFLCTPSQIGVLTNGCEWRFYIGEDHTARMSTIPFLQFDIRDITPKDIAIVHMMSLNEYDYETISSLKQLVSAYQLLSFSPEQIDKLITNAIETKHPSLMHRKRTTSSGKKKQSVKDFGNLSDLIDAGLLSVNDKLHISKREITERNQAMEHPIGTFSDDYVATIVNRTGMMECNGIKTISPSKLVMNLIHSVSSRGYTHMYIIRDGKEVPLQYLRMKYKANRDS